MAGEIRIAGRELNTTELLVLGGLGVLVYMYFRGLGGVAEDVGRAVPKIIGGVFKGAIDETGQAIGLPALSDITTDPGVARWIIDAPRGGYLAASEWSSAAALFKATTMPAGSGTPPAANSKIGQLFPPVIESAGGATGAW